MTHTATLPPPAPLRVPDFPLVVPAGMALEGMCPSRSCQAWYELTPAGQIPEHERAVRSEHPIPGRCPCSGWLARNPKLRRRMYVGGQWL